MVALGAAPLGALAHHMSVHILLMNAVAPLAALALAQGTRPAAAALGTAGALAAATMAQLGVLWAVHAPLVLAAATDSPAMALATQSALFATALTFWMSVLAQRSADRWRALLALLLTGKLFCLLAALLTFAPRVLYPGLTEAHGGAQSLSALSEQQLAGLLMLAICPITYVGAAVAITARWLKELARDPAPTPTPVERRS